MTLVVIVSNSDADCNGMSIDLQKFEGFSEKKGASIMDSEQTQSTKPVLTQHMMYTNRLSNH